MKTNRSTGRFASGMLFLVLLACASPVTFAQQKPEQMAQASSEAWLGLVDSGKYADSWQEASSLFKAAVTKEKWQGMLHSARDPLGKMLTRKLNSATYTKTLPGAPEGEYVVIQFETDFEHKQATTETITPTLDKDGKWRVSGYFIK